MKIDFGSIKSYKPDRGFGFVSSTFSNSRGKIFFHISKIKKKYLELARKVDDQIALETIHFWYEIEVTIKGEQVNRVWLNARDIPQDYTHILNSLRQEVEQIWRNVYLPKPAWLELVTIELFGSVRRQELSNERDNLELQCGILERKQHIDAEIEHLGLMETRRKKELQVTEEGNKKLETELRRQIETPQEYTRILEEKENQPEEKEDQRFQGEIERICEEMEISFLVHFTHVTNLKSILKYGLLGRSQLQKMSLEFKHNDQMRLEGNMEAVCLSISFPNYKMFYKYRQTDPPDSNWVVLLLKPSVLWELNCKFYKENAASNKARDSDRKGHSTHSLALREMFNDYGNITRISLEIKKNYTTNPQAEVLVLSPISVDYIQQVIFSSKAPLEEWVRQKPLGVASHIQFRDSIHYFRPRNDYNHWSSSSDSFAPVYRPPDIPDLNDIPF